VRPGTRTPGKPGDLAFDSHTSGKITNLGWCQGSSEADPSRIKWRQAPDRQWLEAKCVSLIHAVMERVVERVAAKSSVIGAIGAILCAVCAGQAMSAKERASRNA
jgi:hypothetical protein